MELVVISVVALVASLLTFFSGFGLGTILLPAFAIFFPVNIAVALTAVVHLLNSIFTFALVGKHANKGIILRFGLIAVLASFIGAQVLSHLVGLKPLFSYHLFGNSFNIAPVELVVSVLIMFFALWEILPRLQRVSFSQKYLPLGGLLSGFFGGLSGHQGALRSAFLVRSGLSTEGYIATGVTIAILTDIPRISVYFTQFSLVGSKSNVVLVAVAAGAAFLGAILGKLWIKKVTMRIIQILVSIMLFAIALALGGGLI
ncbi:MAG TPA: TSUP family transporter [Dehalococcoidia bacterium]|nr:TSUP family transporter [Dehalococcoidia bacterium]